VRPGRDAALEVVCMYGCMDVYMYYVRVSCLSCMYSAAKGFAVVSSSCLCMSVCLYVCMYPRCTVSPEIGRICAIWYVELLRPAMRIMRIIGSA